MKYETELTFENAEILTKYQLPIAESHLKFWKSKLKLLENQVKKNEFLKKKFDCSSFILHFGHDFSSLRVKLGPNYIEFDCNESLHVREFELHYHSAFACAVAKDKAFSPIPIIKKFYLERLGILVTCDGHSYITEK